jgi:hypothetical protein
VLENEVGNSEAAGSDSAATCLGPSIDLDYIQMESVLNLRNHHTSEVMLQPVLLSFKFQGAIVPKT